MASQEESAGIDWAACAPAGGWKQCTYYLVEVSWRPSNPAHLAILYTGFLNGKGGSPGGYSGVFNATYEPKYQPVERLHQLRVLQVIGDLQPATD